MPSFSVTAIVDGDTFEDSPQWKWNGVTDARVRPTGYDATEIHTIGGQSAKGMLSRHIHGQQVELRSARKIDRRNMVRHVFFGNKNLADYFPQWQ